MTGLAIWNTRNAKPSGTHATQYQWHATQYHSARNTIRHATPFGTHATQCHSARNANIFIVQTVGKVLLNIKHMDKEDHGDRLLWFARMKYIIPPDFQECKPSIWETFRWKARDKEAESYQCLWVDERMYQGARSTGKSEFWPGKPVYDQGLARSADQLWHTSKHGW